MDDSHELTTALVPHIVAKTIAIINVCTVKAAIWINMPFVGKCGTIITASKLPSSALSNLLTFFYSSLKNKTIPLSVSIPGWQGWLAGSPRV